MIPGKPHPKPCERIWAAVYTDSKVECFEVRTVDPKQKTFYPLWHREYPIGTALSGFLYVKLSDWDKLVKEMQRLVDVINEGRNIEQNFEELFRYTSYALRKSPLCVALAASIERLYLTHSKGKKLFLREVEHQIRMLKLFQGRLMLLAENLLNEKSDFRVPLEVGYVNMTKQDRLRYPELTYGGVSLQELQFGGDLLCDYDNFLDRLFQPEQKYAPLQFVVQECVNSEESTDLCNYLLTRYLEGQIEFRTCKFCGRYFGVKKSSKDKYCDRLIGATGKTCKQSGAFRNYEKQYFENPVNKEYKRAYKTRNARVHAGTMTREEFDAWTTEAKVMRMACLQEQITLDEFIAWLDKDKRRTMD